MQFLFAFATNGFVDHLRTNRQPLLDLLLLNARRDGAFACELFVFHQLFVDVLVHKLFLKQATPAIEITYIISAEELLAAKGFLLPGSALTAQFSGQRGTLKKHLSPDPGLCLGSIQVGLTRNALWPNYAPYEFSLADTDGGFRVLLKAKDLQMAVRFSLADRAILMSDDKGIQMFEVILTFNDEGECKLSVNGEGREFWTSKVDGSGRNLVPR
jgi:hypothetical protein